MPLSEEQEAFVDFATDCVEQGITGSILLDSPAGTGKSYSIVELCENLPDVDALEFIQSNIKNTERLILAPTNKACAVLKAETMGKRLPKITTICRFLKWKKDVDEDGNTVTAYGCFNEDGDLADDFVSKIPSLLIIDECSMISQEQADILLQLREFSLIIFTGDTCQLPPVNEGVSKVFSWDHLKTFAFTKNFRLMKSTSPWGKKTAAYITASRDAVVAGKLSNHTKHDIFFDHATFDELLMKAFRDNKDAVLITYSNNNVKQYNDTIRLHLFQKDKEPIEKYYAGERLIFSGFRRTKKKHYRTNDMINIVDVQVSSKELSYATQGEDKDITTKIIKFYKLKDNYGNHWYKPYDAPDEKELKKYFAKIRKYIKEFKNNKKASSSLLKSMWKRFYEIRELYDANINYSYSITIYKAQGSGYSYPFVNYNNIYHCCKRDRDLMLRAIYTSASRCRKNLIMYN